MGHTPLRSHENTCDHFYLSQRNTRIEAKSTPALQNTKGEKSACGMTSEWPSPEELRQRPAAKGAAAHRTAVAMSPAMRYPRILPWASEHTGPSHPTLPNGFHRQRACDWRFDEAYHGSPSESCGSGRGHSNDPRLRPSRRLPAELGTRLRNRRRFLRRRPFNLP
jgi:hypothetical protein